jgi:predicted transcriptional regulator
MSLKQEAERRLTALARRLDSFNRSLAERALPDSRRRQVSELSLKNKALKAGQKVVENGPKNS